MRAVGILGGMGPAAGADFVRLFVQACADHLRSRGLPVNDQAFAPHCLVQLPIADRSAALADAGAEQPLARMLQGLRAMRGMGVETVAIACNTAHAWHAQLQSAFEDMRILNVMEIVAEDLHRRGVEGVGLLATEGTYAAGLYQHALARRAIRCEVPQETQRKELMEGIYAGVKAGRPALAALRFERVAKALVARHGVVELILGCTEIPLAFPAHSVPGVGLIDPADMLARHLAACAYGPEAAWGRPPRDNRGMSENTTPAAERPPLPDHLSVDPRSPHHDARICEYDIGIRLNGQERHDVEEYCLSEGWVRVPAGKTLDRKGKPLLIKIKGKVEAFYKE